MATTKDTPGKFLVYLVIGPTGLPYVGIVYGKQQTVGNRWNQHCNPWKAFKNYRLEKAIAEHGSEAFKVSIIDSADNRDSLSFKERFYIGLYDSHANGYNGNTGGSSIPQVRSPETRNKISKALKGRFISESTRQKMSESAKRKPPISEETRLKLSKAASGVKRVFSEEHKLKLSMALKGKPRAW